MSIFHSKGFRTIGVDTTIPWPRDEVTIEYRGRKFQLLPATDDVQRMIRVATEPGFTQLDADKLILELLSSLAWAEQQSATPTSATWCTVPLNVGLEPPGVVIGDGRFDYLPGPSDAKAKLALALYREGLSVNLVPYQFLGFFKVINILHSHPDQQMKWINENLQNVCDGRARLRVNEIRSDHEDVAKYLFASGRCAIAHASVLPIVNPDDPTDLIRISSDLPLIRELARIAIEKELGVKSSRDFRREFAREQAEPPRDFQ